MAGSVGGDADGCGRDDRAPEEFRRDGSGATVLSREVYAELGYAISNFSPAQYPPGKNFVPHPCASQESTLKMVKIKIRHRFGRKRADGAVKREDIAAAVGMDPVGKKNEKGFGKRINPQGDAGEPGVAVGANRKMPAARAAVTGINVPAKTAALLHAGRGLRAGHHPDSFRFEQARAVQLAQVEHHAGVAGQIGRGGEDPGVAGHPAHETGRRIMRHAPQHHSVGHPGGRDAREFFLVGKIAGINHLQGLVDFPGAKFIQGRMGNAGDDFAEQDEIDVAVEKFPAGRGLGFHGAGHADGGFRPLPFGMGADTLRQARSVGQKLAHGDSLFAITGEFGNIGVNRLIQFDLAALPQNHHRGRGGENFGHGSNIENGVARHGFPGGDEGAMAVSLPIMAGAMFNPDDGPGQALPGDGLVNGGIDFPQSGGVQGPDRGDAGGEKSQDEAKSAARHK